MDIKLPQIGYGSSVVDDYSKGLDLGQKQYDRDSLFEIGKKAMTGDWQGAQSTAFGRGALDTGMKIQDHRDQAATRASEIEKKVSLDAAGIFQNFIDKEVDPAKKHALTQQFITSHPEMSPRLQRYGIDLQDPAAVSGFFQAQARGYQDPLDVEKQKLGLDLTRAQINSANQRADQSKVIEVNGRVVRVPQSGPAEEVYSSSQASGAGALGPYKDAKQLSDVEEGLRKEFTALAKDYTGIREGYRRIETGASINNGAGDLAIVYGYMKMLDPGSVVREGEFATAEQTTGIPPQVLNFYNKAVKGDRLPPEAREKFVNASKQLYDNATLQYSQTKSQYEGLASRKSINPQNVIIDQQSTPSPAGGAGGFTYLGTVP